MSFIFLPNLSVHAGHLVRWGTVGDKQNGSLKEYTGLAEIPSDCPVSYKRIRLGRF